MSAERPRIGWAPLLGALYIITGICVLAGALTRLWGLGRWPLAIDEYYLARAIQNTMHYGIPQFACGGLYVRGLLLQYLSAGLESAGHLSAELAPRLIAAISGLATLPAVYLLGRRLGGREVALTAVAIVAISVWEIEMSRFGRMYAPFQALFCWYLVAYLSYALDRRREALWALLVLSGMGVLVWEGGALLVLTNLFVPFVRNRGNSALGRADWLFLGGACLLFLPVYPLALADLFTFHAPPAYPPEYLTLPEPPSESRLDAAIMPWTTLTQHPLWAALGLVPIGVVAFAVARVFRESRPILALALTTVMACALLQQFELAVATLVVLLLLGMLSWDLLWGPELRSMRVALGLCLLFWVAFGLLTSQWHQPGLGRVRTLELLGYEFIRFPDLLRQVAMPWGRTVPLLALGLFLSLASRIGYACRSSAAASYDERVLLALFVILILLASASLSGRHETRYVYFLYPLAIVIVINAAVQVARALWGRTELALAAAIGVCLLCFGLSEDFRPRHLLDIDSEQINFRIGMSSRLMSHYHPRSDVRAAAQWMSEQAAPGDVVVIAFPGVDFYYPGDYYYMPMTDPRFENYSCNGGATQRWSNLPLLESTQSFDQPPIAGHRVWMILEASRLPQVLARLKPGDWTLKWTSKERDIVIILIRSPRGQT